MLSKFDGKSSERKFRQLAKAPPAIHCTSSGILTVSMFSGTNSNHVFLPLNFLYNTPPSLAYWGLSSTPEVFQDIHIITRLTRKLAKIKYKHGVRLVVLLPFFFIIINHGCFIWGYSLCKVRSLCGMQHQLIPSPCPQSIMPHFFDIRNPNVAKVATTIKCQLTDSRDSFW